MPNETYDGNTIKAHSDDVKKHVATLWGMSFREIADDIGRHPSDSNVFIIQRVSELRLAEETRRMSEETRRMRIATWFAGLVALAVGVAAVLVAAIK